MNRFEIMSKIEVLRAIILSEEFDLEIETEISEEGHYEGVLTTEVEFDGGYEETFISFGVSASIRATEISGGYMEPSDSHEELDSEIWFEGGQIAGEDFELTEEEQSQLEELAKSQINFS